MNKIESFSGEYRWLSNFAPAQVSIDGKTYPSVENAYQACKFLDETARERFVNISAHEAKSLGKSDELGELRPGWDTMKAEIMRYLITQKFTDSNEYGKKLIETGMAEIIEGNTWGDVYWGVCRGRGHNVLGKLLMRRRAELQVTAGVINTSAYVDMQKSWGL